MKKRYEFIVSPETLVFVFGVRTNFYDTSTRLSHHYFCACFSTPFHEFAHLGVGGLLLIESPVVVVHPIRVHRCLPHNQGDDISAWFGHHCAGTH